MEYKLIYIIFHFTFLLFTMTGCSQDKGKNPVIDGSITDNAQEPDKPEFVNYETFGTANNGRLNEISGMVASVNNPGLFWVHNDSGDDPIVYLVDNQMDIVQSVNLQNAVYHETVLDDNGNESEIARVESIRSVDWEDITMTSIDEGNFIVVGDIGDNRAQRRSVALYSFAEPIFDGSTEISVTANKMIIKYAEGPRDAETLMSDPISGELLIMTKRDPRSKIYSFPFVAKEMVIRSKGELNLTPLIEDDGFTNTVVAGDIDRFGNLILKNYSHVFLLENPDKISALELLLGTTPKELNYIVEPQGESICWGLDLISYFTISENRGGVPQPLFRYY